MQKYVSHWSVGLVFRMIKANLIMVLMLFVLIASILLATQYSYTSVQYKTSGILQIDNKNAYVYSELPFTNNQMQDMGAGYTNLSSRSEVATVLLTTDYILNPVIDNNHLNIGIIPVPVGPVKRLMQLLSPQKSMDWLNYLHDSSGSKSISVAEFQVDQRWLNKKFILKIMPKNAYALYLVKEHWFYDEVKLVLRGVVAKKSANQALKISLMLADIKASPGTEFILTKQSHDVVIDTLAEKIAIEPLTVEKKVITSITGVLKISMLGDNSLLQAQVINDLMEQLKLSTYREQHDQLDRLSALVTQQLNQIELNRSKAQAALVAFQTQHKIINVDTQLSEDIHDLVLLRQKLLDNEILLLQYKNIYTAKHPAVMALSKEKQALLANQEHIEQRLKQYPKEQALLLNLKANLEIYQQLYVYLANKEQDIKLHGANIISPVKILTYATAEVQPLIDNIALQQLTTLLLIALLSGLIIVCGGVILSSGNDPAMIPSLLNAKLLAVVPYCSYKYSMRQFELISSYLCAKHQTHKHPVLLNIGSITAGAGKSFIITNCINSLRTLGKTCVHITFGREQHYSSLATVIKQIKRAASNERIVTKINLAEESAKNSEALFELLTAMPKVDFLFIETLPLLESVTFFLLSNLALQNILITCDHDNNHKLHACINDFHNLNKGVHTVIFNFPQWRWLKSPYLLNS